MKTIKPSICLNMIVKNESETITRCLDSVKDLITYWVINDTGSTDGTQQIITDYFKQAGIPGLLIESEWKNFAHNRNIALENALGKADYILIMDADDYFDKPEGFCFHNLSATSYMLKMQRMQLSYYNLRLIRGDLPWKWHGVLHEHLDCHLPYHNKNLNGNYVIKSTIEGSRSKNPNKYKDDAKVLEAALLEEPNNTRYRFYLAQSYHDDNNHEKAIENYQKRVAMGGWAEEVYYSMLQIGRNKQLLGKSPLELINDFLKAYKFRPSRLEALYEAVTLCRQSGCYELGCELGWQARNLKQPNDMLFVEKDIYTWCFLDELSICAAYTKKRKDAAAMMEYLLKSGHTPEAQKPRIEANLCFVKR